MQPVTQTHTTTGAKTPINLDYEPLSSITAAVTPVGTTGEEFDVEVTLDEIFDDQAADYVAPASARWFVIVDETDTPTWLTFDGPWRAIRISVNNAGGGTIVFQVGQATTPRA